MGWDFEALIVKAEVNTGNKNFGLFISELQKNHGVGFWLLQKRTIFEILEN
jgi:hypothetical protein